MATQKDKKRDEQPTAPETTSKTATRSTDQRPDTDDPDTYNPVGMAGHKAGKVAQIENDARKESAADTERAGGSRSDKGSSKA
jgi:hypothetical protein